MLVSEILTKANLLLFNFCQLVDVLLEQGYHLLAGFKLDHVGAVKAIEAVNSQIPSLPRQNVALKMLKSKEVSAKAIGVFGHPFVNCCLDVILV